MPRFLAALCVALLASRAFAFSLEDVAREAAALAARPHQVPATEARLAALSYDEYRAVRFKPEQALWREAGLPFQVHFFPLGRGNVRPLRLHEVVQGEVRPLAVPASSLRNDGTATGLPVAGAAGWRAHFPLNDPSRSDELIVFLGASYFRAVGAGLHYGLSARGLAIDTVGGNSGEEFPAFTAFWLERPAPGARELKFLALLESPRATGAYEFVVRPGVTTTVDVRARIHLRAPVAMLGVAPLTSMFLSGETQPAASDYRPEVHDSDGLQIALGNGTAGAVGGEWLWRPLVNPRGVFVTSFAATSPRGFGLMQRDRAFASYEDLETRYDRRPSAWVEPLGDWGAGRVQLLQFGTPDETHDNIGAWWAPDRLPEPGGAPLELAWRVHFGGEGLARPPGAWVAQSRRGHGYRDEKLPREPEQHQYHVDFVGPMLAGLGADQVRASVSGNANVRALRAIAQPNAVTGGWRVTIDFQRIDPKQAVELRAYLQAGVRTLSETWAYAMPPE
ncbi:MAG: glucan biosynthesis protein G [Rubrivivax sp.]|nr:glucan biosynthesis protein G [Rubrivivax sp.]